MTEHRAPAPGLATFFLPQAAAEVSSHAWVFTGFNWPVLAARLARRLGMGDFVQVLEGGTALDRDTEVLLTSTTDYFAYGDAPCFRGSLGDVLLVVVPRCGAVVVDGANVDVLGRTNTTAIGPVGSPKVRLPGGGGGPDAMARANRLVLLHGGSDPRRIVREVEHATGTPRPGAIVRLITRWGEVELGDAPQALTLVDHESTDLFVGHLRQVGVSTSAATTAPTWDAETQHACAGLLAEAAAAGYAAAAEELAGGEGTRRMGATAGVRSTTR